MRTPDGISMDDALARARELGTDAGKAAASWIYDGNTAQETYRRDLAGFDAGDPAVYDAYREPDFSGEYAGAYSERQLAEDIGIDYDASDPEDLTEIADAWLDAAQDAFWSELERVCRLQVDYGQHDCPCCGDATYDSSHALCSACHDASCEPTTDASGESGYWDCRQDTWSGYELSDQDNAGTDES